MSNDIKSFLQKLQFELEKDPDALISDDDKIIQKLVRHERTSRCLSSPMNSRTRLELVESILNDYLKSTEK